MENSLAQSGSVQKDIGIFFPINGEKNETFSINISKNSIKFIIGWEPFYSVD